jgi:lysozyme
VPSPSRHGRRQAARLTLSATCLALIALLAPAGGGGAGPGPRQVDAATVCGSDVALSGIDVSRHQGPIDWPAVAGSGIRFGIARLANGLTRDLTFQTNYAGMRANGITPGGYIFWQPALDPVAQAHVVIRALASVGFDIGDLPPTIDVEVTGRQSPETIAARLRTTVTTIQASIGVTPFIYTSPKWWDETAKGPQFSDLPLWVAHWRSGCPNLPAAWSEWALWQTSSKGAVPGITGPVDLDQTSGPSLPVYTGAPYMPVLPDIEVQGEVPTPVTYSARAVGYRGIRTSAGCDPDSGTLFRVGTTTVTCTAHTAFGSVSSSFEVTVRRPAPPRFEAALPVEISVDAAGPGGTSVTWAPVTAIDSTGARIPVSCKPSTDSVFPVGRSIVICRATDSFGQQLAGSFMVSVGQRDDAGLRRWR